MEKLQIVGILCLSFSFALSNEFTENEFEIHSTETVEQIESNFMKIENSKKVDIPYALSPSHLISLSRKEEQLYYLLADYERELEQRLSIIRSFKADYEETSFKVINDLGPETNEWDKHSLVAANPILSHRMISRFTREIYDFSEHVSKTVDLNFVSRRIDELKENLEWPTVTDLKDSIYSLIILMDIHGMNATKFSGVIDSYEELMESYIGLSALDCLEIAHIAMMANDYLVLAGDFINAAYHKVIYENDPTTELIKISEMWHNLVEMQAVYYDFEPTDDVLEKTRAYEDQLYESAKGNLNNDYDYYNYMALCRGENFQTEKVMSTLYCWHETEKNPYWKINPQRMELRSSDPYLVEIHDFIHQKLIESIILAYVPVMSFPERSTVALDQSRQISNIRTSVTGWLSNDHTKEIKDFSKKIEFITGLHVVKPWSSESHQMASYTYGGHYLPHLDVLSSGNFTSKIGERMATFIVYLDDTFHGSDTVFTKIGLASRPAKGSALFWYNLHKNGSPDERMTHGGCPVREGFKMITTKWIYDRENFLRRPCSRNENE